jgi:hypothetical protein
MVKVTRLATVIALLAVATIGLAAWAAYRAGQRMPRFYREALAANPIEQEVAGSQFEREALSLHNQIRRVGRWEARFTQDEINGWLAAELPVKFPKALPRGVSQPRVAIDRRLHVAARYQHGDLETIISLTGDTYLTEEPNEIAIRIDQVRAGALPVPLAQFLEEIANAAAVAGLPLRWTELEGRPVALINLVFDPRQFENHQLVLERLELRDGMLIVGGSTEESRPPDLAQGASEHAEQASTHSAESDIRQR